MNTERKNLWVNIATDIRERITQTDVWLAENTQPERVPILNRMILDDESRLRTANEFIRLHS